MCPQEFKSQRAEMKQELSGILNINKPKGLTSHDVVEKIRKISGIQKVGHAGTLDPIAIGVLVVCLGKATRLVQFIMQSPKTYKATLRLGISTDTHDAEGKIINEVPVNVTLEEIKEALQTFLGPIEQIPPLYSAIKVGGKRLYELAREGKAITPPPRQVEIYRIEVLNWESPFLTLEIECSPGTYIRALARDLGEKLGCGAHVTELVRLRSGRFSLEEAVPLEELERNKLKQYLLPPEAALADLPAVILEKGEEKRIRLGQKVKGSPQGGEGLHKVYSFDGKFLGLAEWDVSARMWQPRMVF